VVPFRGALVGVDVREVPECFCCSSIDSIRWLALS
jgi:hypothetical protein